MSRGGADLRSALVTGTSGEFLGARPLPRVLGRPVVWVLGPGGSGRTTVARRLAGEDHLFVDGPALQRALAAQVRRGSWSGELVEAGSVVLDGPCWLGRRPAQASALGTLLAVRAASGRRTLVVQHEEDPSLDLALSSLDPRDLATLGLRFPKGVRGRRRVVRKLCAERGLSAASARGLSSLEPWSYAQVLKALGTR